jgi:hypothetical protein
MVTPSAATIRTLTRIVRHVSDYLRMTCPTVPRIQHWRDAASWNRRAVHGNRLALDVSMSATQEAS